MRAEFAATIFENNTLDLAAYGAFSVTDRPGADRNRAEVAFQRDEDATPLTVETLDCFPEENFESCTNEVKVTV